MNRVARNSRGGDKNVLSHTQELNTKDIKQLINKNKLATTKTTQSSQTRSHRM